MIYLMLSFTENIIYRLIFSVKYNLRECRSTLLPGIGSEPFSYCFEVGTSGTSEQNALRD